MTTKTQCADCGAERTQFHRPLQEGQTLENTPDKKRDKLCERCWRLAYKARYGFEAATAGFTRDYHRTKEPAS